MTLSLIVAAALGLIAVAAAVLAGLGAEEPDPIPVRIDDRRR